MSKITDMVTCPATGGEHDLSLKYIKPTLGTMTCNNCQMDWGDIVRQATALLPTEEGMYQGSTYLWEFDGEDWEPLRAPSGMSGPVFDMPLRKVRLVVE